MAIENIGLYPISIDVYKKHKATTVQANDNDVNGRGLLITLMKDDIPFDSRGINLRIGFRNAIGEERLYDCEVVNALSGTFKVFYPTEMLQGNGGRVVKLEIKAFEASGALLNYAPVFVYVSASEIPNNSISGGNELSTLVNALSEVQGIDNRFGEVNAQLADMSNEIGWVSVKNFGAIGDGINDDSIAFRNAIKYLKELPNSRKVLYIPTPINYYSLKSFDPNFPTHCIVIDFDNLKIFGDGGSIKIQKPIIKSDILTNFDSLLYLYGANGEIENITLEGFTMSGNGDIENSVVYNDYVVHSNVPVPYLSIKNCGFFYAKSCAFHIHSTYVSEIQHSFFGLTLDSGFDLYAAATTSLTIMNSWVVDCKVYGWKFFDLHYSSLINVACDNNIEGWLFAPNPTAYYFYGTVCDSVNMIACGTEGALQGVKIEPSTVIKGFTISNFKAHNVGSLDVLSPARPIIDVTFYSYVLNGLSVTTSGALRYNLGKITGDNVNVLDKSVSRTDAYNEFGTTEGYNMSTYANDVKWNKTVNVNSSAQFKAVLDSLQHATLKRKFTINITGEFTFNTGSAVYVLSGLQGSKLLITGNASGFMLIFTTALKLENCSASIEWYGLSLMMANGSDKYLFALDEGFIGSLMFRYCRFRGDNGTRVSGTIFSGEYRNGKIIFEDTRAEGWNWANVNGMFGDFPYLINQVGTAAPTLYSYPKGFKVINKSPAPGAYEGWICTTGGVDSTATWKGFGLIQS